MKKRFLLTALAVLCVVLCAVGLLACNNKSFDKAQKFMSAVDGVFNSAGFKNSSANEVKKAKTPVALAETKTDGEMLTDVNSLYDAVKTYDNAGVLNVRNLNYVKGDSLYQGANLAALFKSMATILGDNVFSNAYDGSKLGLTGNVIKLEESEYYTLYGGSDGNTTVSVIRIDFKEYAEGKFMYKLAQYGKENGVSFMRFSYYDSEKAAVVLDLQGDISVDLSTYEANYGAFSVAKCTVAIFNNEDYINNGSGAVSAETILKFAKDSLGYGNDTYKSLMSMGKGKELKDKEVGLISSEMSKNIYNNPYLGTDGSMNITVSAEYRIPDDVTVVEKATVPPTKKLIVPAHVQKIKDAPFMYPQFVEEIVFEDPDNGALTQIGEDDEIFEADGMILDIYNHTDYFLTSYTQVKNFTLPKTVKKIAGPIYITTAMETLDLSNYHPDYQLFEGKGSRNEGYTVSLYTSAFNRTNGLYKELGSVEKVYANGDFTLKFNGYNRAEITPDMTPGSFKVDVSEYAVVKDDKSYEYSPSRDIYNMLFALAEENEGSGEQVDFGEYMGYTKIDNLIEELILTGLNEKTDLNSDLYKKVTVSVDEKDFAKAYEALVKCETEKEITFTLTSNGQPKTEINFIDNETLVFEYPERTFIQTPDGEIMMSELKYKQTFYAPQHPESYKIIDGEKQYFVGWSYGKEAVYPDVLAGEKVVNFYQNMYAIYMPATEGLTFTDIDDKNCSVSLDGANADILIIPDVYGGKTVSEIVLENYTCKKIIIPTSVRTANVDILKAIAQNKISGFGSISKISGMEEFLGFSYWYGDTLDELKTCDGVYKENGLYYIGNNSNKYFMLVGADDDLTGQVFIPNGCNICAVKFGDGVTDIVFPNDNYSELKYIYLEFGEVRHMSIPKTVAYIERIKGTVSKTFTFYFTSNLNVYYDAFRELTVDYVHILPESVSYDFMISLRDGWLFKDETKKYLNYTYEQWLELELSSNCKNLYLYSETAPDYEVVSSDFGYWHYDDNMNFVEYPVAD